MKGFGSLQLACHSNSVSQSNKLYSPFILSHVWKFLSDSCTSTSEFVQSCPTLAPPSMEFSRQKYWGGLPFLSPMDLPYPGIEPRSPVLQADVLPSEPPGKPTQITTKSIVNAQPPSSLSDKLILYPLHSGSGSDLS